MFRFTTRELFGITVIAAVSCVLTIIFAPADTLAQLMMASFLFFFGGFCFAAGVAMGRNSKLPG